MRRLVTAGAILAALLMADAVHADIPKPAGFVSDFAGVMQPAARERLEGMLSSLAQKTGVEIAVVTVASLDDRPIEDYAVDLYKTWGIGKKETDEGALILVAPRDKRVRIEVGYGLEGALNDAEAGRIIRDLMIPFFKEGDFTRGIVAGAQATMGVVLEEKGIEAGALGDMRTVAASPPSGTGGPLSTIFKIMALIVMIYLFIRHPWLFLLFLSSMGRGGGGRGGFGGGRGGFGGGMSGGGGASGGW